METKTVYGKAIRQADRETLRQTHTQTHTQTHGQTQTGREGDRLIESKTEIVNAKAIRQPDGQRSGTDVDTATSRK